jgi:hypothetical protein
MMMLKNRFSTIIPMSTIMQDHTRDRDDDEVTPADPPVQPKGMVQHEVLAIAKTKTKKDGEQSSTCHYVLIQS